MHDIPEQGLFQLYADFAEQPVALIGDAAKPEFQERGQVVTV